MIMSLAVVHLRIDAKKDPNKDSGSKGLDAWMQFERHMPLGGWKIGASMAPYIVRACIYDMQAKQRYNVPVSVDNSGMVIFDKKNGKLENAPSFLGNIYPKGIQYNRLYTNEAETIRFQKTK